LNGGVRKNHRGEGEALRKINIQGLPPNKGGKVISGYLREGNREGDNLYGIGGANEGEVGKLKKEEGSGVENKESYI